MNNAAKSRVIRSVLQELGVDTTFEEAKARAGSRGLALKYKAWKANYDRVFGNAGAGADGAAMKRERPKIQETLPVARTKTPGDDKGADTIRVFAASIENATGPVLSELLQTCVELWKRIERVEDFRGEAKPGP